MEYIGKTKQNLLSIVLNNHLIIHFGKKPQTTSRGSSGHLGQSDSFIRLISANQIQNFFVIQRQLDEKKANQKSPHRGLAKTNPIRRLKTSPNATLTSHQRAQVWGTYFERLLPHTLIILYIFGISKPFPIEWC